MYNEVKTGDIPCLRFLKGTDYVLYVGPELNRFQKRKLDSPDIRVPVIYLPDILAQLSEPVVKYNFPGISLPGRLSAESIYNRIRAELGGSITPKSRLIIRYVGDDLVVCDANKSFSLMHSYLINGCRIHRESDPYHFRESDLCFRVVPPPKPTADDKFDVDMILALEDAKAKIQDLLLKGCPPELILSWLNESVKLSRLRITPKLGIVLPDYDNMEIKMGPLPKAVFLLFLRHPEGIMFSDLADHRDELKRIYSRLCRFDDPQKIDDSISRLVDPFDNSINEKCAAIKKAFVLKISDTVARNYYIDGPQGSKKGISLDRTLVEWEGII